MLTINSGESTLWTGIATTAAGVMLSSVGQAGMGLSGSGISRIGALAMAAVSPAFVTFLLFKVRPLDLLWSFHVRLMMFRSPESH